MSLGSHTMSPWRRTFRNVSILTQQIIIYYINQELIYQKMFKMVKL